MDGWRGNLERSRTGGLLPFLPALTLAQDIEGAVPADVLNEELELKGWPRKRKEYARLLALSPARTYKKGWTG